MIFINIEIHNYLNKTEHQLNNPKFNNPIEFAEWTYEKAKINFNTTFPNFPIYNNFIYWCNLGINIGSEQNKLRPVIIVGTTIKSTIAIIIPLTSKRIKDKFWYHVDLEKIDSTALVEQLRVISKIRIVNPFRQKGKMVIISEIDWEKINQQLQALYRLKPLKNK